ncbi:Acyl-protein thioesterase 1 [Rhodotorula toruloides]|nr:Acyl-protein thioesterase 1 [Rhodotorula toruloides]
MSATPLLASTTPSTSAVSSPRMSLGDDDKCTPLLGAAASKERYTPALPPLPATTKRPSTRRLLSPRALAAFVVIVVALGCGLYATRSSLAVPPAAAAYVDSLHGMFGTTQRVATLVEQMHEPPSTAFESDGIFVQDAAKGNHTVTAILIHGLGDSGDGRPFIWSMPQEFPWVRWVAPTSDYLNVTVREGKKTRAWFDIHTFEDVYEDEDVKGYVHSQQQLNRLIDEERQRMVTAGKEPRIVLMGFSQGGAMTLLSTLTARSENRIEAAIVLSTFLPMIEELDEVFSPAARDTPILWMHGREDPFLSLENAELGVSRLSTPPINLSRLKFKTYEGLMHTWTNEELDDVADWFEANVPERRQHSAQDAFHTLSPAEHEQEKHDAEEKMEVKWFKAEAEVPARRRWRRSMVPRSLRRHSRRRVGPKRLLTGGVLPGQFSF